MRRRNIRWLKTINNPDTTTAKMEIEHTDFIKVSLAQTGIQLEFNWHRTVAFVFTLLTFYTSTYQRQEIFVCVKTTVQTCPPGPELLANDSSTRLRGIDSALNFSIHCRAWSLCSFVSKLGTLSVGVTAWLLAMELSALHKGYMLRWRRTRERKDIV